MNRRMLAGLMVLAASAAASAETLELRIVSTDGASKVWVDQPSVHDVYIQGKLSNPGSTRGLGLWMADVRNVGTHEIDIGDAEDFTLLVPLAMEGFDRTLGYANPVWGTTPRSGYTGTAVGVINVLRQVGGGQNTMYQFSGQPWLTGAATLGVANAGAWVDLAWGTVAFDGDAPGDAVVLELTNAVATTIDPGAGGMPYAVTPAKVVFAEPRGQQLKVAHVIPLAGAQSVGYHEPGVLGEIGWQGGDVPFGIEIGTNVNTAGLSESRAFNRSGNLLWINMIFAEPMEAEDVIVDIAPNPGATYTLTQGATAYEVELHWDAAPTINLRDTSGGPQFHYHLELGGAATGAFSLAFIQGDINCDGYVTQADRDQVNWPGNWSLDLCDMVEIRAEVSRDGYNNAFDMFQVATNVGWPLATDPPLTVLCAEDPMIACPGIPEDDCNYNRVADDLDIAGGTSMDCNNNGIPEECEWFLEMIADCNENAVADTCDLVNGTSADCDGNAIPDECDLANGLQTDCNSNGVPDMCDLAGGTSADCNVNGAPDECDIRTNGLDQWAHAVLDVSSEFTPYAPYYCAVQALGVPSLTQYGDSIQAWTPVDADGGDEYISLLYEYWGYSSGVMVRESYNGGFVAQIDLLDTEDTWHTVWQGTDLCTPGALCDFTATWPLTDYRVRAIKVTIDTDTVIGDWEEIDAVRLDGVLGDSADVNTNGIPDECE